MKQGKVFGYLIAVGLILLSSQLVGAEPTKDSLEKVKSGIKDKKAVLVDVREKREWDAGYVEGAIRLALSELQAGETAESLEKKLPEKKIIYTYCAAGVRSCIAAEFLSEHGYDVRPLKPGYRDLLKAGFQPTK